MLVSLLGIIAGFCFATCGVPAARAAYKTKTATAPLSVTVMIVIGGVCMFSYLFLTYGFNLLLTLNYGIEVASWGLILYYHVIEFLKSKQEN
jgi:hypothetical protein